MPMPKRKNKMATALDKARRRARVARVAMKEQRNRTPIEGAIGGGVGAAVDHYAGDFTLANVTIGWSAAIALGLSVASIYTKNSDLAAVSAGMAGYASGQIVAGLLS